MSTLKHYHLMTSVIGLHHASYLTTPALYPLLHECEALTNITL